MKRTTVLILAASLAGVLTVGATRTRRSSRRLVGNRSNIYGA